MWNKNSSITYCLQNFSKEEKLAREDKFYCETCCSLQEAQKRLRVKKVPNNLVVHLKRFKFFEQFQRYKKKLSHRVVFPFELRLCNTTEQTESTSEAECLYDLFGIVIHVGSGPNHGHYVSIIKNHNNWLIFDDDGVQLIDEAGIHSCFGTTQETLTTTNCGYLLFYQKHNSKLDQFPTFNGTKGNFSKPTIPIGIPSQTS